MLATKPRWVVIASLLFVALFLALHFVGQFFDRVPPAADLGTDGRNLAQVPPARVSIANVDAWASHLRDEGLVRLLPNEGSEDAEGSVVRGLGRLASDDFQFAVRSIERVVDKRRNALYRHYQKEAWSSDEERSLRESELIHDLRAAEAFSDALSRGSYFVVASTEDKLPTPPGVRALNLGVKHRDKLALLVVLARKSDYGLDSIEEHVSRVRKAWLGKIAYDFNGKADAERQSLIERWIQNHPDDTAWRSRVFPEGLIVDSDALLVRVAM